MTCVKCEVVRARVRANAMKLLGKSPYDIVEALTDAYGFFYYATEDEDSACIEVRRTPAHGRKLPYCIVRF